MNTVAAFDDLYRRLSENMLVGTNQEPSRRTIQRVLAAYDAEFEKLTALLNSSEWPSAVPPALICDQQSEADKMQRARDILEWATKGNLHGMKFLDFGCGEGHTVKVAVEYSPALSVGYDIKPSSNEWEVFNNNQLLTTDYLNVLGKGPYDFILLYDVLDHAADPLDVLRKVKELSHEHTIIAARCHPWAARHAGHAYQRLNKAYIQLVFSPDELNFMGLDLDVPTKVIYPIKTYMSWFEQTGMKVLSKDVIQRTTEDFFEKNILVRNRLQTLYRSEKGETFPRVQLEHEFVDWRLSI